VTTEQTDRAPLGDAELDRLVDNFNAYDHQTAQNIFAVMHHAQGKGPVVHSDAHGGYYVVNSYAQVREALSNPQIYSSTHGVAFPHHQTLMMPPIDLDPPLQQDFRGLLNRHFSRAGIKQYADAIQTIAEQTVAAFMDEGSADLHSDFAAPFTAEVLARVILNIDDDDLFQRARAVASLISRNDPNEEGDKRAALEAICGEILDARKESGVRQSDAIDSLLYGEVDGGRPVSRDERVGSLMILIMGGLSTTNAAITSIFYHATQKPGLEEHLRTTDWSKTEVDEFLRYEPPVGSLSRTVMQDTTLGGQELHKGDTVLLHFAGANRDGTVFPHPDELDLERERNPHFSFGLGNHRCIGSNLARMQIDIGARELLSKVEDLRLAPGTEMERETGTGSGWNALPVTFKRRSS
jgi:cytochrome P450